METFPGIHIRSVEELLGCGDLNVTAANGTRIPYEGWVEIKFELCSYTDCHQVVVQFLVSNESLDLSIIGYNVIEEVSKGYTDENDNHTALTYALMSSLRGSSSEKISLLINFLQASTQPDLCLLKTAKQVVIPKASSLLVSCRANTGAIDRRTPALFEPDPSKPWPSGLEMSETLVQLQSGTACCVKIEVTNEINHDIVLKGKTVIGRLHLVGSVISMDVHLRDPMGQEQNSPTPDGLFTQSDEVNIDNITEQSSYNDLLAAIDLEDLTEKQRRQARQLVLDELESFSVDDSDIGCIPGLQMNINLIDKQLVQQRYSHVPRPLYAEVKHYIEDLLNRGSIRPSRSSYSSPVVCICKEEG